MFIFLWFHRDGMLRSAHSGDSRSFSDNLCLPTRWEKCNPLLYSVMTNTPNTDEHACHRDCPLADGCSYSH